MYHKINILTAPNSFLSFSVGDMLRKVIDGGIMSPMMHCFGDCGVLIKLQKACLWCTRWNVVVLVAFLTTRHELSYEMERMQLYL